MNADASFQPYPPLDALLSPLCANDWSPEQAAELAALLATDDRACEAYVCRMHLHGELLWRYGHQRATSQVLPEPQVSSGQNVLPDTPATTLANPWRLAFPARIVALAACLLLIGYFAAMVVMVSLSRNKPVVAERAAERAVAEITYADAEWSADKSEIRNQKSEIALGEPLSIQSGLIELQLKQGTTLLIEGPADWQITGENSATLTHGKLVAKVPQQAIGFTLETPTAKIVDLGTEFGVEVNATGETDVLVHRGQVETSATGHAAKGVPSKGVRVTAGNALRVSGGNLKSIDPSAAKFVTEIPRSGDVTDSFDPGKLSGLRLWLRSDRGLTTDANGRVERWKDQSGNKFDAEQSDPDHRPLLQGADKSAKAAAVQFDGLNDFLVGQRGLDFDLSGDLTIFVAIAGFQKFQGNVGIFSIASIGGKDWNCLDGLALRQGLSAGSPIIEAVQASNLDWATIPGFGSLRAEAQVPPQGPVVISVTKQNGVATIRVNGNTARADEYNYGPVADQPSRSCAGYVLGTRFDNTKLTVPLHYFGAVQIAEIVVYDRALTGKEGSRADAYLIDQYLVTESKTHSPQGGEKQP